jgi:hypothetical protein
VARRGSVASGCATAVDDATASGANCVPTTIVTPGGGGGGGTAAGGAGTGTLARTGGDLDGLAAVAVASTALGGVFLALGRRRRPLGV